jgi:hypothetical protein
VRPRRSARRRVDPWTPESARPDPSCPLDARGEDPALLATSGLTDFVREFPLTANGRRYQFDFAFVAGRTILETNGRRWHDDAADYEHDNEKWSVPGRYGFKLVLATWEKVTTRPLELVREVRATLAA